MHQQVDALSRQLLASNLSFLLCIRPSQGRESGVAASKTMAQAENLVLWPHISSSHESERDFRDTVNTAVGKPLAAAVGTFSSNLPLPI